MKVRLNYNQNAYSGKLNDLIYYWVPELNQLLARRRPTKKGVNQHNKSFGDNASILSRLIGNPEYKTDLKLYLGLLRDAGMNEAVTRWYSLYNKLIWAFLRKYPEWEINDLSRAEIIAQGLSCRSVKAAVEDGLLPQVEGYQRFDNLI